MPYNGSGTYSPPGASFPAVANTLIMSTKFNNVINDIATALSTAITKDGQTTITANLPMGGYRHTGVGAPSARDHYATVATVQDSTNSYAVSGGAADAQTLTLSPAITAYSEGMLVGFRAGYTNTSSTPTLNVNGVGAKTIVMQDGSSLTAGAITAGRLYLAQYYNNNWRLTLREALPAVPAAGKILRSNGSAWVASTGTYPDTAAYEGQIIRATGANAYAATSARYPDGVSGVGKIIRSDGSHSFVASTAAYPDTVTSAGQIIRADGSNSFAVSTMTYPDTTSDDYIPYATGSNALGGGSSALQFASDRTLKIASSTSDPGIEITGTNPAGASIVMTGYGSSRVYTSYTLTSAITWSMGCEGNFGGSAFYFSEAATPNSSNTMVFSSGGGVQFPRVSTTASAANAYLDNGSSPANNLLRSTSSLRYKRDVEPVDAERIDAVLKLEPIWYRSKCEADRKDWSWYGLGAEQVAEVDPRLVHWTREQVGEDVTTVYDEVADTEDVPTVRYVAEEVDGRPVMRMVPDVERRQLYDEIPVIDERGDPVLVDGKQVTRRLKRTRRVPREVRTPKFSGQLIPDGVMYERVAVLLLGKVKQLEGRLRALEAK